MSAQTVLKSVPPRRPKVFKRYLLTLIAGWLFLIALYASSLYSYLLFHTVTELLSITVSGAIFILVWNTRDRIDSQYVLFIGLSLAFVSALDLTHALAYSGMPIFAGYDANLPTQLWIAARYLQSLSLLAGLVFVKRQVPIGPVMAAFGFVTTLLLVAIFARAFPDCYIAGSGLTDFKKISEYLIVIILLAASAGLWQTRSGFDPQLVRLLMLANVFTIGGELAFTTYISVYGPSNLIGHLLRLIAVGLYYRAIVHDGLMRPLEVLHHSLNQSEARFRSYFELPLTGRAITAPNQTWLEMNSTLCDLLGYTSAELRRMTWLQVTHPDDVADDLRQFNRVMAGEIDGFTLEKRFIRKDGQIIHTDLAVQCLRRPDRSVDYFVTLIQDITERKRAGAALLEHRTNLSALIENTDGSIWAVDQHYRLIVGNALFHRNVAAVLGRELIAGDSVLLPQFPPEANAEWQGHYDRALQGERFSAETLTRFKATPEYTEYRFSPIVSGAGRITGVTVFGLNITERKQAEEALRDSQARLQRAESVAHFGNWSFNLKDRLVYASAGARLIYGLQGETWSMVEVQGIPLPEYRPRLDAALKDLIEHQRPYDLEFRIRRPSDGQLRDIHSIAEYDPVRHIAFGVIHDITARKQIESQLQISLTKYQTLFETLPVGVTIADRSGQITESNRAASDILGLSKEAHARRQIDGAEWRIIRPDGSPMLPDEFASVRALKEQRQVSNVEMGVVKDADQTTWISVTAAPLDLEEAGVIIAYMDITEARRAESALRDSQRQITQLLQTTDQGIYGLDLAGRCTFINQSGLKMLGYPLNECLGRNMHDLIHHSHADGSPYPVEDCPIFKSKSTGEGCQIDDEVLWRKAGTAFPAAYSAYPIVENGIILGAVVTFSDITARKQAEEALRQSEARWHTVINTSPDGICITTLDGVIQFASDKLLALHGYDQPVEMLDHNAFEFLDDACHDEATRRIQAMLAGIYPGVAEYKVIRRDGSPFYADINAEVLRDAAGQPVNLLLVERDVTARKHAEDALRESERRFRDMMDQVQLCCATLDTQANITFANDYFLKLTGWQRDEVMGYNWFDLFVPAQAAVRQDLYRNLAAGTVPLQYENEILTRDGAHRLVDWSNSVVHDAAGGVAGIAGIGVDITERKQAEAALLRQNQYLAALQETTLELSAQLDLDRLFENIVTRAAALVDAAGGFCDMVDPATNQLLPRVGVGVLAQSRTVVVQPGEGVAGIVWQTGQPLVIQDYDGWANRVSKYDRGTLSAIIGVPLLKNQQTLGVLGLAYEYNSGRTFGQDAIEIPMQLARLAAIAIDNARLFEAERARHRELKAVYEASLQVTRSLDVMSVLDAISMATLELTPADYVHIFLYDGEHFDAGSAMSKQGRVAPLGQPRQDGITYTAARSGETYFIEDTLHHPTFNAVTRQNPPQYAIAALPLISEATVVGVMNVTYGCVHRFADEEQRALKLLAAQVASAIKNARLHQQVRDHAQQLEQRVAKRTADLQAANLRLTELDHLKDEFLSRTSHELRTPLTSIKIYLELLESGKPEKREKYLQTLKREADRLHTLIEEVLTFSQLNLIPDRLALIDLNYLIESHLTTWQRLTAGRDLALYLNLSREQLLAQADGELCFQALNRLLANAVNYTPAGSVTLSTAPRDDNGQHWVTISVTDTGPGITPDDLPHIFERFYRGRAAANYKTPGTGIGLAICHEIAQKLGGKVTVQTQVGVGSTFTLWLPPDKAQ